MQHLLSAKQDTQAKKKAYRSDIDGLRAVAILSVVVYHAFPEYLSGGFAGVDIFFVISGYLIFGIILKGIYSGGLSFSEFYAHRIKRIFPALILVVLATYLFGWFTLFPDEFRKLGRHMFAGLGFHENFLLKRESGYFDVSSEVKPLMHLWSLAVEEQFYLIFPIVVWGCWRLRLNIFFAIFVVATLSFLLNVIGVSKDAVGTFFMPHTRVWELLVGAMLAYFTVNSMGVGYGKLFKWIPVPLRMLGHGGRLNDFLSVIGFTLLLLSFALLRKDYLFPGWWALMPVLGALLIISSGPSACINKFVLSNRAMVFIGLISYPLYLWHWPILTYSRILHSEPPTATFVTGCVVLSVLLAWLTYWLVERPIRFGSNTWIKTASLCSIALAVGLFGRITYKLDGIESRSVVEKNPLARSAPRDENYQVSGCGLSEQDSKEFIICSSDSRGKAAFALIGDSKASALSTGLFEYKNPSGYWKMVGGNGPSGASVPVLSAAPVYLKYQNLARLTLQSIMSDPDIKVVVISTAARALFQLDNTDSIEGLPTSPYAEVAFDGLNNMVSNIVGAGKKVVLVVDNPTLKDPKKCVPRLTNSRLLDSLFGLGDNKPCSISYDRQLDLSAAYRNVLNEIERSHSGSVRVFDVMDTLCDMRSRVCGAVSNGNLLYRYADHVSFYSSALIAERLVPFVEKFSGEAPMSTGVH